MRRIWQEALDYVASLNKQNYLGYNDWRLPNINELGSLVNYGEADQAAWLNKQGFSNVQASWYWSSSTCANGTYGAWVVSMSNGYVSGFSKGYYPYVWPVRSGQLGKFGSSFISVPKTGQTISYAAGDDGDLQVGRVCLTDPRFTDNGNGTVTDNLTGLMWMKEGNL